MRIDIYFISGNIELYEPIAMGAGFGNSCVMGATFLNAKNMREKGISLSTGYYGNGNNLEETYVIQDITLVEPEDIDLVLKVEVDGRKIMGLDDEGVLLNPAEYIAFTELILSSDSDSSDDNEEVEIDDLS